MKRSKKVALALGVAVAVHLILFFSLSPGLEGLAADEPASADIAAAPAEPIAEAAQPAMADEPLDETWPEPADEPEATPERAKPAAPVKTTKVVTPPPAPEPVIATAAAISTDRNYASRVRQHLGRFAGALPAGASGEARVQFVVEVDGLVSDVHLVQFSGHAGLDAMALNLPTQAQPLPLPGQLPQRLEVPLQAAAP